MGNTANRIVEVFPHGAPAYGDAHTPVGRGDDAHLHRSGLDGAHQLIEAVARRGRRLLLGEDQEAADEIVYVAYLLHDVLEKLGVLGADALALAHHPGGDLDDAKRIADLVGDAGGHFPEGGQPFLPAWLCLQLVQLAQERDHTDQRPG